MSVPWSFLAGLCFTLAVGALTLWAARSWVRARPGDGPSLEAAAIALAGFAGLVLLFQNVLVHDALWYYSYLRSALVDENFDLYDEFVLRNPNGMYLPPPGTPIFHLGTALLVTPLALLVRPIAILLGRLDVVPGGDGYGPLEVGAATLTSALLALGGVALIHRLARKYSGGSASAVAQVALLYASPLAFFAFVWPGYPHPATVFLGAAFLLVWAGYDPPYPPWRAFLLGLLAGVLALVHPQDILYLALPLLDLLPRLPGRGRAEAAGTSCLLAAGAVCGFLPQLAAWTATSGRPLPHVYAEIGDPFRWSRPALWDTLFSGYNGLLVWTPLTGVAILGLFFLRREHPRIFRGLVALVLLEWWAIASYGYWWGGASFGARYFLSAYPAMGVGLAMIVHRVARRMGLVLTGLASVPFVYWNLLLMAQFRLEWIQHNRTPDLAAILVRQVSDAPAAVLRGLCGTFHWNQVLVLEHIRAAIDGGSVSGTVGWTFAAILGFLLVLGWIRWLGSAVGPGARRSFRAAALLVMGSSTLATFGVLSVIEGNERSRVLAEARSTPAQVAARRIRVFYLEPPEEGPTDDHPTAVLYPNGDGSERRESLRLDVISFLDNGAEVEEGRIAAWLYVREASCGNLSFPLRAGFETAETSPGRVEVRDRMKHGIENARVIHSWWQDDGSSQHYWGHAYLASWSLPAGCRPEQVAVRVADGAATLEIRRLVLAVIRG